MTRPCFLVNQDLKGLKKKNYKINIFYLKKKDWREKKLQYYDYCGKDSQAYKIASLII